AGPDQDLLRPLDASSDGLCRSVQDGMPMDTTPRQDGKCAATVGNAPVLEVTGISKHFGSIEALTDVSLTLECGEVVGLMGDNGAGKSTLMRIIAGNFRPSQGAIAIEGRPISFHNPIDARRAGIEIVYQDLALCDNLTAAANVFLGRELRIGF